MNPNINESLHTCYFLPLEAQTLHVPPFLSENSFPKFENALLLAKNGPGQLTTINFPPKKVELSQKLFTDLIIR